jgi:hypothetical protein
LSIYDRDLLNNARRDFGLLLHVEDGKIVLTEAPDGVKVTIEVRPGGLLVYSMRENFSDIIPVIWIQRISLEPNLSGYSKETIMLLIRRGSTDEKVFLSVDYPEYLMNGLEKIIKDHEKKMAAKTGGSDFGELLRQLGQLHQEGLITDDEYAERKSAVLKRMTEE